MPTVLKFLSAGTGHGQKVALTSEIKHPESDMLDLQEGLENLVYIKYWTE